MKKENENLLFLMWAAALIATLGSLFFSEGLGYTPCELCWYQRILMYPLVIIYGASLLKKQISLAFPGIVMSGMGMLLSIYHYLVQKVPALEAAGGSCGIVPCNGEYMNVFGFITIPFLAGIGFIIIFITHARLLLKQRNRQS
ncbi:disulfide oxidoreductase [Halobacillus salinarum]|uniref:Probable disulfide formation protein n=1 Tax=Halobacillus salinarum TaxID=2932257 RepID=A0ABY4EHF9_9BACI|nr:disulfide oxidoreductase [Halobacillus salinarum]UOQ43498.1 disulfide oxidoreductase [Halobacillus salinarum]